MKTIPSIDHSDQAIPNLTSHAVIRMQQRAISRNAIDAALTYGRRIHAKGTTFCVVGRKEVQRLAKLGIDLSSIEGVQVLLGGDGAVIIAATTCTRLRQRLVQIGITNIEITSLEPP